MLFRPRTEHVDVDAAYFFAFFNHHLDRFFNGLCARPHSYQDEFCIRCTCIVEEVIFPAGDFADLLHIAFGYIRYAVIEFIQRFTMLHVRFCRFAERNRFRIIRVHAAGTESFDSFHIQHRAELFIRNDFYLLNFVRCTESIEEVQDRNAAGNSRCMDDGSQIHDFLYARFTHHADARATHSHGIIMTGKNRIPVGGYCTGCYVEYARQKFAGNLKHVGKHDHHALG